jgi:hypothetical protein
MDILLIKEEISFKDLIDYCFNKITSEKKVNSKQDLLDELSQVSVKKTSKKGGNYKKDSYNDFSSKVIDVWSCVFWRTQKELAKDIELVLGDFLRIWKSEDDQIILSINPKIGFESFVLLDNKLQSKSKIGL